MPEFVKDAKKFPGNLKLSFGRLVAVCIAGYQYGLRLPLFTQEMFTQQFRSFLLHQNILLKA